MRFQDCYASGFWTHSILWEEGTNRYLGFVFGTGRREHEVDAWWWSVDAYGVGTDDEEAESRREAKAEARKAAAEAFAWSTWAIEPDE